MYKLFTVELFRYTFLSKNKTTYRAIARKTGVNPLQVYQLAHGKRAANSKDYEILKELKDHCIILNFVPY